LARALQRRGYPDNAKLIREAIADHARIVAAMQLELDHRASVSQAWFDRFQTAEASLAACREVLKMCKGVVNEGSALDQAIDAARAALPLAGEG
jgi:hypothetical protein